MVVVVEVVVAAAAERPGQQQYGGMHDPFSDPFFSNAGFGGFVGGGMQSMMNSMMGGGMGMMQQRDFSSFFLFAFQPSEKHERLGGTTKSRIKR